ncbi:AAA family ATPase [Paenibacillus oryzisoli]|uniref:AAA family ATPase n=1 Tax=Paenibacillus oryzisoli TaxID=1850517 RepID=UPI003D2C48A1
MSYFIKDIVLSKTMFVNYNIDDRRNKVLPNLSKINIFVGENNSGKSVFLRKLFSLTDLVFYPSTIVIDSINELKKRMRDEVVQILNEYKIDDYEGIKQSIDFIEKIEKIDINKDHLTRIMNVVSKLERPSPDGVIFYNGAMVRDLPIGNKDELVKKIKNLGNTLKYQLQENREEISFDFRRIYFPSLRGLRPLSKTNDLNLERTHKDYFDKDFFQMFQRLSIFSGYKMYDWIQELRLSKYEKRERLDRYEVFLSKEFFGGKKVELTADRDSDVLLIKIGDEKEQPIYNLGDGIQTIIIFTFPLFIYQNEKLLVFIEEPEISLHPGLQRRLIEILYNSEEFKNTQFFFTTHSNHFLDLTLDYSQISVYTFRKLLGEKVGKEIPSNFIVENVSNENHSALEILGVKNSSVFLSNCTIWVEGITDRYYVRHYLKLYQEYLKLGEKEILREDYHFSFVEYSGNNITHWSFLDDETDEDGAFKSMDVGKLCSKLFLITDKDSERKLSRQKKLEQKLQERYYCLDCKEIENLLKLDVLKKVIAEYEYLEIEELEFTSVFTEDNYKNEYLGSFIEGKLINKQRRGSYAQESGTIKDKVKFCEKAIKHITSYDDLSEEAKELAKRTYVFIRSNNS